MSNGSNAVHHAFTRAKILPVARVLNAKPAFEQLLNGFDCGGQTKPMVHLQVLVEQQAQAVARTSNPTSSL